MNGVEIDNLEFYGISRALKWYGVWLALAAFWLLFWLVRPLLLPRWMALQKGREDVLISTRDITVGVPVLLLWQWVEARRLRKLHSIGAELG